jgi:indolepyruvate ferredoxin oxidoreductase
MNAPLPLPGVTLDDKYTLERGSAFMSGTQALVRLPMLQRVRDAQVGLNTAGFISGYRGSPLGGLDQSLWKAREHLSKHNIVFNPGLNEDLAATSVWGSQQVNMYPGAKYDGVFGMWYGKGPGVDRTGDVFKHANAAGTSKHGGVLVLAGDDHGAKSSSLPHQSDHIFKACGLPVFYPSSVQEYLDLGLHGWAMSRYSGLWVAMKTVTEVVEACASVQIDPDRVNIVLPEDFALPSDGLNIRWPDTPLDQEARLLDYKFYAALAYIRANKLNHAVIDAPNAWFGIITAGKAYLDTRQALLDLGLDDARCRALGIRLFKCGVVWPLEAQTTRGFATGLQEILVVEEKRQLIEYALKEELYNWRDDVRPKIYGKFDERDGHGGEWSMPMGRWLLPAHAELSPALIAKAIAARLLNPGEYGKRFHLDADTRRHIEARLAIIQAKDKAALSPIEIARERGEQPADQLANPLQRVPTFCSGCPHNTSTRVPEGSRAVAGIGCHYMVTWMPDRNTSTFSQMGGEGVAWIGQTQFTDETHIFANLGDGTYFHSGLLAIRASIAAKVNITYKILYNDAVAMTGGQPIDGTLTVPDVVAQMKAERATRIDVVTDDPEKYEDIVSSDLYKNTFANVLIHHRDHLDALQRELREIPGCTVLVYDQTCASEKRRRRKRGAYPDPAKRMVINEAVCEGCGDCSTQSSCVSVEPLETDYGRKRTINQSSCNKDYSCVKGFCPSFVSVLGGQLRKPVSIAARANAGFDFHTQLAKLPEATHVAWSEQGVVTNAQAYGIMVTGVGGTGVVTIGQLLGMAAHIEGKGVSVLDMAGLAQKGGAVFSHVQIAQAQDQLFSTRIAAGDADLVIGCDAIVAVSGEALSKMRQQVTRALINTDLAPTSDFLRNPDWQVDGADIAKQIRAAAGERDVEFIPANTIATALLGDAIYTNPFMLGFAWQKGWIPLTRASLERAIELNAISVEKNLLAFGWGRLGAHDLPSVQALAMPKTATVIDFPALHQKGKSLDEMLALRVADLTAYQNEGYANRYAALVKQVATQEQRVCGSDTLAKAVARYLFKLMAYKDEYEVARLHSSAAFKQKLAAQFEGDFRLEYHLAPPLISRVDPKTGRPKKIKFGSWMRFVFLGLAKAKFLRGSVLDPFGYTKERRHEQALIGRYEALVQELMARLPEQIRGYGPVKAAHLAKVEPQWREMLIAWQQIGSKPTKESKAA